MGVGIHGFSRYINASSLENDGTFICSAHKNNIETITV